MPTAMEKVSTVSQRAAVPFHGVRVEAKREVWTVFTYRACSGEAFGIPGRENSRLLVRAGLMKSDDASVQCWRSKK
jgi:hypothetical protein